MAQTDPRQLLVATSEILKDLKIPYLITGGMAVLVWGRPRFTADIDIIVELREHHIDALEKALMSLGKRGYVDKSAISESMLREGEFNFIDGNTGVKVDFWILKAENPFDKSRLKRRIAKKILNKTVYFTSPEDLILAKLVWFKETQSSRHLEDAESVMRISQKRLDMKYLNQWAIRLEVVDLLGRIKQT